MLLTKMKIRGRLILTFVIIMVLFIISMITSMINVRDVSNSLEVFYNQPFSVVSISLDMKYSIVSAERYIYKAIIENDSQITKQYVDSARQEFSSFTDDLASIEENFIGDKKLVNDFKSIMSNAMPIGKQILELLSQDKSVEAFNVLNEQYVPLLEKSYVVLNDISLESKQQALQHYESGLKTKNISIITLITMALISLIFSIFICFYVTKSLTRPIFEIEKAALQMSKGNLKADILYSSSDELGHLADCMREMMATLSSYVSNMDKVLNRLANKDFTVSVDMDYLGDFAPMKTSMVNIIKIFNGISRNLFISSKQIAEGSENIAVASESLALGASEQSNLVQELVSTIHGVAEHVNINAGNARNVSKLSTDSVKEIEKGNEYMKNLLSAMNEITTQSSEISNIIKVIDDISSQTNMLSLNAAIEAARAGEQGAGFAVVANEIGKLANECGEAAKNTTQLIENSIKAVSEGSKLADETADVLKNVVNSSNKTDKLVNEIASACSQQAESLDNVLKGIQQISSVVETNSSITQEASASSEELSSQASTLEKMLSSFKVDI